MVYVGSPTKARGELRAVIGIDAAWTATEPSGVALLVEDARGWRSAAVAPSYADFVTLGDGGSVDWDRSRIEGNPPEPERLLRAARAIAPGATVEVVCLDIPLSRGAITGRRRADNDVSRLFGARGCGTHSPSVLRPGRISELLRDGLAESGFPLVTSLTSAHVPAALEVYPHTALLALLAARYRVPYKVSKASKFWPNEARDVRRQRVLEQWRRITAALRTHLEVQLDIPTQFPTASRMKRYEDVIDALVCAWVGIEYLNGRVSAFGDEEGAIWSPS